MTTQNLLPGGLGPLFHVPISMVFASGSNETVITCPSGNPNWFYPYHIGRDLWFIENPEQGYVVKRITNPVMPLHPHSSVGTFIYISKTDTTRIILSSGTYDSNVGAVRFDATGDIFRVDEALTATNILVRGNAITNNNSDREHVSWNLESHTDFDNDNDVDWKIVIEGNCTSESGKFHIVDDGDTFNAKADPLATYASDDTIKVGFENIPPDKLWGWLQFSNRSTAPLFGQVINFAQLKLEVFDKTNISDYSSGIMLTQSGSVMQLNESVSLSNFVGVNSINGVGATWSGVIGSGSISGIESTQLGFTMDVVESGHGIVANDYITIRGVHGMTEINNQEYSVTSVSGIKIGFPNNIETFSPYTSGGLWSKANTTVQLPSRDLSVLESNSSDVGDMAFIRLETATKTTERIPEWFPILSYDDELDIVKVGPPPQNDGSSGFPFTIWDRRGHIMYVGGAENGDIPLLGSGWFTVQSVDDSANEVTLNLIPSGVVNGIWHLNPPIMTMHMTHSEGDISIPSMNAVGGATTPPFFESNGWKTVCGDAREKDSYLDSDWTADVLFMAFPSGETSSIIIGNESNSYIPGHTAQSQATSFKSIIQQAIDEEHKSFGFMLKSHISAWTPVDQWYGPSGAPSYIEYVAGNADDRIQDQWPLLTIGFGETANVDLFIKGLGVTADSVDLFISNFETISSSGDMFIKGVDNVSTSSDFFIQGFDTTTISGDLFISGLELITMSGNLFINSHDTVFASGDLFIQGLDVTVTSGDLFIAGQNNIATSGELFIEGHNLISLSSNLFIHGFADSSGVESPTLFIIGHDILFTSGDLFIGGQNIATTSGNLYIRGRDTLSISGDLFVEGHTTITTSKDLFVGGLDNIISSGNLFIEGLDTVSTSGDLFIEGFDTISTSDDLFIEGHEIINSSGNLFLHGLDVASISGDMFIKGVDVIQSLVDLFAKGHNTISLSGDLFISGDTGVPIISSSIDLFMFSHDFVSSSVDLFIRGNDTIQTSVDLFLEGHETFNASGNLFINGFVESSGVAPITLFIIGYDILSTSGNLFINGQDIATTSCNLFVRGLDVVSKSGDLFIGGKDLTYTSGDLFIPGLDTISVSVDLYTLGPIASSGQTDLFINGLLETVVLSGSVPLFINGFEPIPDVICPALDPTASIQIKPALISIYQSRIDALINQLGKNVRLIFDPILTPCPNCSYDTLRKRSNGIYRPGGPRPFKRGRKCPYCKGRGLNETSVEKCIKCLLQWNPVDAENYGISVSSGKDIVRFKTYLTNFDDLVGAESAIANYDIKDIIELRVKRITEPILVGLRESRYCISFWELV